MEVHPRAALRERRRGLPGPAPAEVGRRRLGPAGRAGRRLRHLRRLRRLELRPGRGRLGRAADRHDPHGSHVHVHGLRPCGDVLGDADVGRRLHVRAPGDGPVGRLSHRHGDPHRVRDRAGRDRRVHRRLRRVAGHPRDHDRLAAVPRLLRRVHRRAPHRRRRGAEGHVRDHGAGRRRARGLRRGDDPGVQRVEPHRHQARHEQVRRQRLPAVRLRGRAQRVRLRHLVLPRGRGRAARRRGGARPEEGHAEGHHRRDAHPARVRRADPHAGAGRRRVGDDHGLRQPAAAGRRHGARRGPFIGEFVNYAGLAGLSRASSRSSSPTRASSSRSRGRATSRARCR